MNSSLLTKADRLKCLRNRLRNSIVGKLLVFTVAEWQVTRDETLAKIQSAFPGDHLLVIRSSATDEDRLGSLAGYYHTESRVLAGDRVSLIRSISRVIDSYSRDGRVPCPEDQVIIQPQISRVVLSGVVLTREPKSNTPYYIINYDSTTGRTDTVTRGVVGRALRVARWQEATMLPSPWDSLLIAVQEIEQLFQPEALDIEFGIDHSNRIHIFQVRPLGVNAFTTGNDDRQVEKVVGQLKAELERVTSNVHNLPGSRTILSDMADWNPAEIIGGRPNVLDYSLYRFLVTKSTWNQARVSIGYTDVTPSELMVILADKPYIDTRVSFNSLTPDGLSHGFREALMEFYLDKLADRPELQDKVEFEVLFTCFDPLFDERSSELRESGFSAAEVTHFRQHLLSFTNDLLQKSTSIICDDLKTVQQLKNLQNVHSSPPGDARALLDQAHRLLTDCQQLGILPFSRLARLAFVGLALLRSLLKQGVINESFFDSFLSSIETVATRMNRDFCKLAEGTLGMESFMKQHGHLRPGTYNILAPRYDHSPDLFSALQVPKQETSLATEFVIDRAIITRIDEALARHGIQYPARALLDFIRQAIEYREYSKFEFTKSLSDAIELIALAGEQMGFSREELALIDLDTLMQARDSTLFDLEYTKDLWRETISKNRENKAAYKKVALPPVLTHVKDLVVVPYYESYPNFVTHKRVEGTIHVLDQFDANNIPDVTGKIILLQNADPGYDWIFTRRPRGLITKYGGAGSHMTIRCAEFGLPAAIGCGEVIFDRLAMAHRVLIDCGTETIAPM